MMIQRLLGPKERDVGARLKSRDRATWDRLVSEQQRRLFNLHLRLTGDREAAADLTQETFVSAYETVHRFEGRSSPETWLYGVALNCNRDWQRRMGRHDPPEDLDENAADPEPSAAELAELNQRSDLVCEAVQRLPEQYRRVVALRYFAGVSAADMAASEGVDAATVRWRLHQALNKLWVMLQPSLGKEAQDDHGEAGRLRVAP